MQIAVAGSAEVYHALDLLEQTMSVKEMQQAAAAAQHPSTQSYCSYWRLSKYDSSWGLESQNVDRHCWGERGNGRGGVGRDECGSELRKKETL